VAIAAASNCGSLTTDHPSGTESLKAGWKRAKIFRGASQANEQMVVVGIDSRTPATKIRGNDDIACPDFEGPGLGIVAVRSKRRITDEIPRPAVNL
jgi:hypothetical protein